MKNKKKIGWMKVFSSIVWACFGIQSSKNHKRDFQSNELYKFIIAAAIVLISFVLFVITISKVAFIYIK